MARLCGPLRGDREEPPFTGHTLERVGAAILEAQSGARDEILHGAGHQDVIGSGGGGDSRADVHGQAPDLRSDDLALAGMHADADGEAERTDRVADRARAADGARGSVEHREESVARRVDFASAESCELAPDRTVVTIEKIAPPPVTE